MATEQYSIGYEEGFQNGWNAAVDAKPEQPAQQEPVRVPVTDNTYNYTKSLAEAIFKQHFASDEHYSSGRIVWGVNDTVIGILTQIDNMVADMVRKPAPAQRKPLTDEQTMAAYKLACSYGVYESNAFALTEKMFLIFKENT